MQESTTNVSTSAMCKGEECNDLRLLYQLVVHDLAFFKRQQWAVTNYTLLLDAGIVGVAQLVKDDVSGCERFFLSILATIGTGAAIYILYKLNQSLKLGRKRLEAIRQKLTQAFRDAFLISEKPDEPISIVFLLVGVLLAGIAAVWWLLLCKL